jgi:hypothetical protein
MSGTATITDLWRMSAMELANAIRSKHASSYGSQRRLASSCVTTWPSRPKVLSNSNR